MLVNGLILVKEPEHNASVSENLVSENMNMISKLKPKGPRGGGIGPSWGQASQFVFGERHSREMLRGDPFKRTPSILAWILTINFTSHAKQVSHRPAHESG